MPDQPTLRGPRVTLRPPRLEDADDRWRWFADPAVTRYLPLAGRTALPREDVERYLKSILAGTAGVLDFTVEDESGRPIGACSLRGFDDADRAELSLYLGETDTWGKGYGREAMLLLIRHGFLDLGLHTIWLVVRADNLRAVRLYEGLGFRHDGVYRAAVKEDGRYLDKLLMNLLREEWQDDNLRD